MNDLPTISNEEQEILNNAIRDFPLISVMAMGVSEHEIEDVKTGKLVKMRVLSVQVPNDSQGITWVMHNYVFDPEYLDVVPEGVIIRRTPRTVN